MRVVATAGHVDHGKSALVRALTGTDPDRFPEERERGLTIDLGFAFCTLPSGQVVGFVDVPGHVRFVKNMVAGVGAVDVAVLVIAANEGWMPQTEEHAQILDLLDVRHGMVALTKADIVDADTLELTRLEIEERVPWPLVVVDSLSGRGLDAVRTTLDDVLATAPPPRDLGRPRLWVDRVFAAKGAGTVVTGTSTGGTFRRDDDVIVEPGGRRARIRRIESHHEQLEEIGPGARVALNLGGVDYKNVRRGDAVVAPDQWSIVDTLDVSLRALSGYTVPRRTSVDVHVGSGEQLGQIRLLDKDGHLARVRLTTPLPLAPGDRLVLRSSGAQATVAGAEILDVAPATRTADALARCALPLAARVLAARPWVTPDEFARLAGRDAQTGEAERVGAWLVAPDEVRRVRERATELLRDGWPAITSVADACGVDVAQLRAAMGEALVESPVNDPAARSLVDALAAEPFAPPAPATLGASQALVRALLRAGVLVDLDGVIFATAALDDARARIREAVLAKGELTVADIRDLLGSTRKYVLPIANRMDAEGVTKRRGDVRVPGARAVARDADP
jgi:selenocysteine-specific elongation factor